MPSDEEIYDDKQGWGDFEKIWKQRPALTE